MLPVATSDPVRAVTALVAARRAGATPLVLPPGAAQGEGPDGGPPGLVACVARAARRLGGPPAGLLALATSGTTAAPRTVLRTTASWEAAVPAFGELAGYRPQDVAWAPGAPSSTLTLWAVWHALRTGVPVVATGPWRGVPRSSGLDAVTVLHCVPGVLADVLEARAQGRLAALRTAVVAGAALPAALRARCAALGVALAEYYGAAELSFVAQDGDGSGLRAFPGAELRVRDGLVEVRSPYLSTGYVPVPGVPPGPFRIGADGWAGVGDRGALTADGVLVVAGRGDEALSVGATVVLVEDVERVLGAVAGVAEVACLAEDDARLGSRPLAAVRAAGGTDAEALVRAMRAAARAGLPPAARPVRYVLLDRFPRTSAGKVARDRLRAQALATASRVLPGQPPGS